MAAGWQADSRMTAEAAGSAGATVHAIHPEQIARYDKAWNAGYQRIMDTHANEPLDILHIVREEVTPSSPGILTPAQRGGWRGMTDALDKLIYDKTMDEVRNG